MIHRSNPDPDPLRTARSEWLSVFYDTHRESDLQAVATIFGGFASIIDRGLPPSPELIEAYKKLLEVRDLIFEATRANRKNTRD